MRFRLFAPLLLLVLLLPLLMVGCATVTSTPTATPVNQAAQDLLDQGKFREAAQSWLATADSTRSPVRDRALARAADAFQQGGDAEAARSALAQSNRRKLSGEDALIHDMVNARFMIDDGHGRDALPLLVQSRANVPDGLRVRWHRLRAIAFEAAGKTFDAAAEQAWVLQSAKPHDRSAGARNIERLLAGLDDGVLAQRSANLAAGEPVYPFAARELRKRGLPVPRPIGNEASALMQDFPPADADGYRPPARLAVLLPMSGPLAAAATGVRDGLLAGYYGDARQRTTLRFYDSGGTGNGARAAMKKALADGAQMVVGPLGRDEVSAIFSDGDPDVPVVALNRPQDTPPSGSLSFALLPDDEGLSLADRLAARGLQDVLVFVQSDDNAQRALNALREGLRLRGGSIVAEIKVGDAANELGGRIADALAKAEHPPTAIVLLLKSTQAPLVLAQIRASPLSGLPRLATSSIVGGSKSANELDGIEFPELPWLLDQSDALPDATALAHSLPSARGASQRLFAFGRDAWSLVGYYERLQSDPAFVINGATGRLRIDSIGALQREPTWAELSGGHPRPAPKHESRDAGNAH
jgi:outer membrane PBP1 activator LpoA protein